MKHIKLPKLVDSRLLNNNLSQLSLSSLSPSLPHLSPPFHLKSYKPLLSHPQLPLSSKILDSAKSIKDSAGSILTSNLTKYVVSNFIGIMLIILSIIVLYIWYQKLSYERFISYNLELTGPSPYDPIKPYNFMSKSTD